MIEEQYLKYFKDKKITVLGLGLLGRGVGDTQFLVESGADVICTDTRTDVVLKDSIAQITKEKHENLELVIGENRFQDFEHRDFILTGPALPLKYEYVEHARKNKIPVVMSAALVCDIIMKEFEGVTIIGVTGTRGKSTTTQLIAHILKESFATTEQDAKSGSRVHIGGNVRGTANLPLLKEIEDGDYLVLELDSWQLQGFGEVKISPHIAVFTSFMDDHLNYYNGNRELYFNDKANIYRNQKEFDVLIASEDANKAIMSFDKKSHAIVPYVQTLEMPLIGNHNQVLASLAYEAVSQCGLDDESIRKGIASFKAVSGRLEDLGVFKAKTTMSSGGGSPDSQSEFRGVRVFNDNNATTGDATVAALHAIIETYKTKPIVIVGGSDKGLDMTAFEKELQENAKEIIFLQGTGTEKLQMTKKYEYEQLEECVKQAFLLAQEGDVIIFSPGFASFSPYFKNEYERNDTFVKEVEKYR